MSLFDTFARLFGTSLKETLLSHVPVETIEPLRNREGRSVHENAPLVMEDGSLLSLVDLGGSMVLFGESPSDNALELEDVIAAVRNPMATSFVKAGHAIQIVEVRDPNEAGHVLDRALARTRNVAQMQKINIDDILIERRRHLSSRIVNETTTVALVTRASILSGDESRAASRVRAEEIKNVPLTRYSPDLVMGEETLTTRHMSFVEAMMQNFALHGQQSVRLLSPDDAVRRIRASIYPELTSTIDQWIPRIIGGRTKRARAARDRGSKIPQTNIVAMPYRKEEMQATDMSNLFVPPLNEQIITDNARVIDNEIVQIGNMLFSSFDITLAPELLQPFNDLIRKIEDGPKVSWRISFLIEAGGLQTIRLQEQFVRTMLFAAPTRNRRIRDAIDDLREIDGVSDSIVRLRMSLSCWTRIEGPENMSDALGAIREQASHLRRATERWGGCHTDALAGDPLACCMSSVPGLGPTSSTAPAAAAPLADTLSMMPLNRPAAPWADNGSLLFRTFDGRLWPFQPGSSKQSAWIYLISGVMGKGKSVLLNALNLAMALSPQTVVVNGRMLLPRIVILDIGFSSSGLISLIREALPEGYKHEAIYERMSHSRRINPFDTQPGLRYPLAAERSFLINILTVVCTSEGETSPNEGIVDLIGYVIDLAYSKSDRNPKSYTIGNRDIDAFLRSKNYVPDDRTSWWEIVDYLFESGEYHLSMMAQREAVPQMQDLISAAQDNQIKDLFGEMSLVKTGEPIIHAFNRMISSAIREIPILSGSTQFDLANARIISLDLDEVTRMVSPRMASLMYMLARYVSTRDFFLWEDEIREIKGMPKHYLEYHVERARNSKETVKVLGADEWHRTGNLLGTQKQSILDARESRKHNIRMIFASQFLGDYSEDLINIASAYFICSASSQHECDFVCTKLGLNQASRLVLQRSLNGPGKEGSPLFVVMRMESQGTHALPSLQQPLLLTLGPVELWAFSTNAMDAALRNYLYEMIGPPNARLLLGRRFPGGSAKTLIEARLNQMTENGQNASEEATEGLIKRMARDLAEEWTKSKDLGKEFS